MTTHTPGPWSVDQSKTCVTNNTGTSVIAEVMCPYTPGRQLANARLIAAAPELLAMLQRINREVDDNDINADLTDAISKLVARLEAP
jgi:hypothetical protein